MTYSNILPFSHSSGGPGVCQWMNYKHDSSRNLILLEKQYRSPAGRGQDMALLSLLKIQDDSCLWRNQTFHNIAVAMPNMLYSCNIHQSVSHVRTRISHVVYAYRGCTH